MKRSEFLKWANDEIYGSEKLARKVEEEFGVTWDPEEPTLPEKLVVIEIGKAGLSDNPPYRFLVPANRAFESHEDQRLAYDAAAEAYNSENRYMRVVERALAEVRSATPSFERIVAILEGREDLKQQEPARKWPESLELREWSGRHYLCVGDGYFTLPSDVAEEADRRWREEPKLRERIRSLEGEA